MTNRKHTRTWNRFILTSLLFAQAGQASAICQEETIENATRKLTRQLSLIGGDHTSLFAVDDPIVFVASTALPFHTPSLRTLPPEEELDQLSTKIPADESVALTTQNGEDERLVYSELGELMTWAANCTGFSVKILTAIVKDESALITRPANDAGGGNGASGAGHMRNPALKELMGNLGIWEPRMNAPTRQIEAFENLVKNCYDFKDEDPIPTALTDVIANLREEAARSGSSVGQAGLDRFKKWLRPNYDSKSSRSTLREALLSVHASLRRLEALDMDLVAVMLYFNKSFAQARGKLALALEIYGEGAGKKNRFIETPFESPKPETASLRSNLFSDHSCQTQPTESLVNKFSTLCEGDIKCVESLANELPKPLIIKPREHFDI